MTSNSDQPGSHSPGVPGLATRSNTGPFLVTLCRVAVPVSIRLPPESSLKRHSFFTSRVSQPDGTTRLYLQMGYFDTLAEAHQCAQRMRTTYPEAVAMRATSEVLNQAAAGIPTLSAKSSVAPSNQTASRQTPIEQILTDTQVMRVLETRRSAPAHGERPEISLLRPEDTSTRRALKYAVAQGAPVSFAVQLRWSVQPIDAASIPALDIFRSYKLYFTQGHRDGRSWFSARLGFFADAISAKQVAYYVRSKFEGAAVVPVTEEERTRARASAADRATPTDPFQHRIDKALESWQSGQPTTTPAASVPSSAKISSSAAAQPTGKRRMDKLEQTLEMLAASEMWDDPDSHTATGVRHLTVKVEKQRRGRS